MRRILNVRYMIINFILIIINDPRCPSRPSTTIDRRDPNSSATPPSSNHSRHSARSSGSCRSCSSSNTSSPTRRRPRERQSRAAHQPHFEYALVQPRKERQIFFDGGAAFGKPDGDDGGFQRARFTNVNGAAVEFSLATGTRGPHLIKKRIVHHADH